MLPILKSPSMVLNNHQGVGTKGLVISSLNLVLIEVPMTIAHL